MSELQSLTGLTPGMLKRAERARRLQETRLDELVDNNSGQGDNNRQMRKVEMLADPSATPDKVCCGCSVHFFVLEAFPCAVSCNPGMHAGISCFM